MYSCELVCLPSYTEGIAPSLLEALALGKPIVATNVGGTPEVVKDGINGYLCQPNTKSLTKALMKALENPIKLKEMGQNNLKKAKRFDRKTTIRKFENLFQFLLNENYRFFY